MMTWEETILYARDQGGYDEILYFSYLTNNLEDDIFRFGESEEFIQTLKILERYRKVENPVLLDVGAGNGLASINFAKRGYNVIAVEPDHSDTLGSGAIRRIKTLSKLDNLSILECHAEDLPLASNSVDVAYCRQSMHHATNLSQFLCQISRVLKVGGMLLTVRDHVCKDNDEKKQFLNAHPFHRYYGGENAYSDYEYKSAMSNAGLELLKVYSSDTTVINRFPTQKDRIKFGITKSAKTRTATYLKLASNLSFWLTFMKDQVGFYPKTENTPGRLYSYLATKT